MIADAESILRVCGLGSYLHIGCSESTLVFELLKRSVDAYGLDASLEIIHKNSQRAPGRFFLGSLINYPFTANAFDTIVIGQAVFSFSLEELEKVFSILALMTKRHLVFCLPETNSKTYYSHMQTYHRADLEAAAFKTNFYRHPRSQLIVPYHELDELNKWKYLFFELAPKQCEDISLQPTDWLSRVDNEADAETAKYMVAANLIRSRDTVLELNCGAGAGTAILATCSQGSHFMGYDQNQQAIEYARAKYGVSNRFLSYEANNFTALPDHSIDYIVALSGLNEAEDLPFLLNEIKRILKPDGRLFGCISDINLASKLNKEDNWNSLQTLVNQYFIIDGRWIQTINPHCHKNNEIHPTQLDEKITRRVEKWLFSACANPIVDNKKHYLNPFHSLKAQVVPTHVDFEKYYDNAWLYRVMIQLGERLADKKILLNFCRTIVESSRLGSADQGAALCVIAYQLLESGYLDTNETTLLFEKIAAFQSAFDHQNMHAYRWSISLHYIHARLLLALGDHENALKQFLICAHMDPVVVTPLLATKTISSHMYCGLIYASKNKSDEAREQFSLGIKTAYRAMQGDWQNIVGSLDNPLPFGLTEAAEVLDIASQCSQALHALERHQTIPGYFWDKINLKRFGLVEWNKSLERENALLRKSLMGQIN